MRQVTLNYGALIASIALVFTQSAVSQTAISAHLNYERVKVRISVRCPNLAAPEPGEKNRYQETEGSFAGPDTSNSSEPTAKPAPPACPPTSSSTTPNGFSALPAQAQTPPVIAQMNADESVTNSDGSRTTVWKDGTVITDFPDGGTTTKFPDGRTRTRAANGASATMDAGGNIIETTPASATSPSTLSTPLPSETTKPDLIWLDSINGASLRRDCGSLPLPPSHDMDSWFVPKSVEERCRKGALDDVNPPSSHPPQEDHRAGTPPTSSSSDGNDHTHSTNPDEGFQGSPLPQYSCKGEAPSTRERRTCAAELKPAINSTHTKP